MVAESAGENSFNIGLLLFEILHIQYFRMQYLLQFQSYLNGVFVINGKTFSDHVPEKIFKLDKPFKSYDHNPICMSVLRNSVQYM